MFSRREQWAICHRKDLLVRGNNTNNFCETAMRVLKDRVLNRTKAFNVQQLVDFVCTRMELYYERRCVDVANNVLYRVQQSRFLLPATDTIDPQYINRVGEMEFEVQSSVDPSCHYRVDMTVGLCTCKEGNTGGPCKHQASIVRQFSLTSWNFIPENPEMRQLLCLIGTGKLHDVSWFHSLRGAQSTSHLTPAVTTDTLNESTHSDHTDRPAETASSSLPTPLPASSSASSVEPESMIADLDSFMAMLKGKVSANPEYFGPALAAFNRKAGKITSDSHLVSALNTFGNNSGISLPRTTCKSNGKLISSKRIPVQPTAVQRRQSALPGSRFKGVGRPTKDSQAGAQKRPLSGDGCLLSASSMPKRKKAPHSLSQCVKDNKSLSKKHHQIHK